MRIQNNEMIFETNINSIKENMYKNNGLVQEQIKNYIIEISSIKKLIRAFPLKVKIETKIYS